MADPRVDPSAEPRLAGERVWEVLEHCMDLSEPRYREAFLEGLAAAEPEVAAAVAGLLARDVSGDGFLEEAVCDLMTRPPPVLGPYRLGRCLGFGGNGAVFRAERAEGQPSYPVAVKILWQRLDDETGPQFAEERELLGGLEHPGICRMLHSGTTENGTPWFAMELVDGRPIDRYCVESGSSLRQRLRLYLDVLAAVEYAHANRLLHCDLKPSNVLVDTHGRPRLLDFGIAGRLEAGTTGGGMTAFTPGYASPEQLRGEPLGPAADVFSLGALLYQLICDRPPFARPTAHPTARVAAHPAAHPIAEGGAVYKTRDEMLRLVEAGPAPASRALSARATKDRRRSPIRPREVRGRLDAVLARAMAPRAEERYLSVSRFAEDLERFLDQRPVRARPSSPVERLTLAVRRHRLSFVAGLILATATTVIAWQGVRLDEERTRATAEAQRAKTSSAFLLDSLADLDPAAQPTGELSARELIARARRRIDERDLGADLRAELLLSVGSLFGGVGAYEPAVKALDEALRLRPHDPRILESLAVARIRVGDYDEGERLARQAIVLREAADGDQGLRAPMRTLAWAVLRNSRNEEARLAEAEALASRALDMATAQGAGELELARSERLKASVLHQMGRHQEALGLARQALARLRRSGAPAYELAVATNELALAEQKNGQIAVAIEDLRTVVSTLEGLYGEEHPEVAGALNNLALALAEDRQFAEATAIFDLALQRYESTLGAEHAMTLNCASSAAYVLQRAGELERAEALHRRVARGLESALGTDHPFIPLAWAYLAENLALQGRVDEATEVMARAEDAADPDDDTGMAPATASIAAFVAGQLRPSPQLEKQLERTCRLLAERFGLRSRLARDARERLERYRTRWAD